jgi:hypothetical protein
MPAIPATATQPRPAKPAPMASVHVCIDTAGNTTRLPVADLVAVA